MGINSLALRGSESSLIQVQGDYPRMHNTSTAQAEFTSEFARFALQGISSTVGRTVGSPQGSNSYLIR